MPVTVLQALSSGGIGGTERMALTLIERLDPCRVASEVSVLDSLGDTAGQIAARGVPVHWLGGRGGPLGSAHRLARVISERSIDVIHLYGFRMSLVGRLALSLVSRTRPKVIHGIRGLHLGDWPEAESWKTAVAVYIERLAGRRVDVYAANSPGAIELLTARGIPAAKFRLIPNGIDVTYWAPERNPPISPAVIACVANLRPVKRLELVIEAATYLKARHGSAFRIVLVGEGSLRGALERRVAQCGVGDVVELIGAQSPAAIRDLYRTATAALLTSAWEGMPVSLLEAMACACPPIGTNVPGIAQVIEHGQTGLLVSSDPKAIADACSELIVNSPRREALARNARHIAVAEYSVERMVDSYETLYTRLPEARARW